MIKNLKKKVVVAMSGGVDSSFAAALLKEEGYDVLGVTIHHYDGNESLESAEEAAKNLEIPWHVLDFTKEFKSIVIDYFCNEYLAGRTPNPVSYTHLRAHETRHDLVRRLLLEKKKKNKNNKNT